MKDNTKILEDISTLTQICHSNSDGPTLKIEENEIKNKLIEYDEEIREIKATEADDSYDTSAEMADRNIEIITKKVIQSTNNELKNKRAEMEELKEKEQEYSNTLHGLKRTKTSYEKYIASLKERLTASAENAISDRYNNTISSTEMKIIKQEERIREVEEKYQGIQEEIEALHQEIVSLETRLESKKSLLAEAQDNLQNKDLYVDKAKKEKAARRINEIEIKKSELNSRLDDIYKDPKYLEMKIKEILAEEMDNFEARNYIIELLTTASKVPYSDQYVDKKMEEALLEATQQRDSFAAEIDNKTYDIMDTVSPEQIRVDFLNNRISYWQMEIKKLEEKVSSIDKDETFHYAEKASELDELISKLKDETKEFKERYQKESDSNLSNKAILKIAYEEKKADLEAAEEIASKFRKNEAEDVEEAGRIVKQDIEKLNAKASEAEEEIYQIKARLDSRKSGNKDLGAKNKDREKLEQLAQVVIDIKHRRQFADRTFDIAKRLELNLGMKLVNAIYSEEEQERLSKEVMVPFEEEITQDNVVTNTNENKENEEVTNNQIVDNNSMNIETANIQTENEGHVEDVESVPEIPVAEEAPDISVEEAINEIPTEPVIENVLENNAESSEGVKDVSSNALPIEEVQEEQTPTVQMEETNQVVENPTISTIEIPNINEQATLPTDDNQSISQGVNNIQEENIVSEEISTDNTEESIAQPMPQLPDLPSDDASSIPVIPVAEPSIDDNDSFNNTDLTSPSQEPSIPSIDIESEENEPA